ncbi:tail tube monomer [Sinorhizobium phage phiM7]|uniref:Tail tube monomer n=3 Tax=Emdodecavirus TaxID=1980937 RepID=S5MV73_9CAUD|nr:tail tube monomer [Sinorhizobium phage phiM12]YP_009212358.1 tail tube monomer [Sinorhizobium phage phiN3]YP_009601229.1 tail tube monomer [Sinorhizobium phage phiM7]AKF13011.1 tail tube monomer [Sinorhizobium phage phiM19]AGR47792.1 tail tube monomer [Sinorhizobium phage phiM12]AKF12651.1 tail tube monomer [Sinorhizobium phage phiM7]AKF13383.1 tail tube monomer [Sinorhizobium phage phiN3]
MAFRLDEFRANLNSVGGLAKPSKFAVYITAPSFITGVASSYDSFAEDDLTFAMNDGINVADARVLSMLCDSAQLPGKTLQVVETRPQGFGKVSKIPFDIHHDPLSLSFMLDNDHRVMNFLQYWFQEIINTNSDFEGNSATFKNRTAYELNYKKTYATTMLIHFFSSVDENSFIEYEFHDVYPMQIAPIQLGWDQNDQFAKVNVEFAYSAYSTMRGSLGFLGTYATRGVDYYQSSGRYGNLLSALTDTSYGIQNLIESFTNI